MAFVSADRVKETTSTTGTGSYTLSGTAASGGFRTFATGVGNGNQCDYCVTDGSSYEVGRGTLSGGTTLTRDIIISSSTGSAISWAAGSKDIFATLAQKTITEGGNDTATNLTATGSTQGTALALTSSINYITTTPTGTGVILPAGRVGDHKVIINHGANPLLVYPATGETVEGGAANAPFTLERGQCYEISCTAAGAWDGIGVNIYDDENRCTIMPAVASNPPVPPTSTILTSYVAPIAGKQMIWTYGSRNKPEAMQPHLGNMRVQWQASISNTTALASGVGMGTAVVVGTATSRSIATTNTATQTRRTGYVSAATAGSLASYYQTATSHCLSNGSGLGGIYSVTRFCVSDASTVSGARHFCGWSTSTSAPTNVEPSSITNCFGMAQLSTDATQWYICYGGSVAQTAIALGTGLGAPTDTTTTWEVSFYSPPIGNGIDIYYQVTNLATGASVSGTLTGTAGVALPSNTSLILHRMWRCNNATALAVGLDMSLVYIETKL